MIFRSQTANPQDKLDPINRSDAKMQDEKHSPKSNTFSHWRKKAGYLSHDGSEFESIHIFLCRFLADHHSPDPLIHQSLLADNPQ